MGGKGKGKKAAAVGQETPYVKRVDLYKFLGKWLLRSYPDETGRPLMSPPDALQPARLRATLDSSCSELLRRPLMGINLAAASVDGFTVFAEGLETQLQQLRGSWRRSRFWAQCGTSTCAERSSGTRQKAKTLARHSCEAFATSPETTATRWQLQRRPPRLSTWP